MFDANAPHSATPRILDPLPYLDSGPGWYLRKEEPGEWTRFKPRKGFSQNIKDY